MKRNTDVASTPDSLLRRLGIILACGSLAACAGTSATVPYPAFIQVADLPDIFVAGLPGIRAKRLAGNPDTRRSSNLFALPAEWSFTTGGFPDKSVEIYVLGGAVVLGEFTLTAGGYAYLPDGSAGVPLRTEGNAAQILYFLNDADPASVIRTPLITNRRLVPWTAISDDPNEVGLSIKELRSDPGSGARTWLLRVEPMTSLPWQSRAVPEEGFLLEGSYQHSECVNGIPATEVYSSGGYFLRPGNAVNGGPESGAIETSVWLLRTRSEGETTTVSECAADPATS